MTEYVVGFAFYQEYVVLIEKKRPSWQAGRLNGVGGRVEIGEGIVQAMVREFQEETGVAIKDEDWNHFATLSGGTDWRVYFLTADLEYQDFVETATQTDEEVRVFIWSSVNERNAIPNLTWLLPMARNLRYEISPRKAQRIVLTEVYK